MIKWFKMPNGELMEVDTVIEQGLLIDYYPTPYLKECAQERPWTGKPSTTQLIKGTREAYLQALTDYAIDPDDQAFRIIGTRGHHKLELRADEKMLAEGKMEKDEVTGMLDLLEEDPQRPGWYILWDYKTSGSYKVMKALGIVEKSRPMVDSDGVPVVYRKAGTRTEGRKKIAFKAGDPRIEKYYEPDPEQRDIPDWDLQVNRYRIAAEEYYGVKISRACIFIPVRDGDTQVAKGRGITRKTYVIPIPEMDPAKVEEYFNRKRDVLVGAITGYQFSVDNGDSEEKAVKDNVPPACDKLEAWEGRKCAKYCAVAERCVQIGGNPYISPADLAGKEGV